MVQAQPPPELRLKHPMVAICLKLDSSYDIGVAYTIMRAAQAWSLGTTSVPPKQMGGAVGGAVGSAVGGAVGGAVFTKVDVKLDGEVNTRANVANPSTSPKNMVDCGRQRKNTSSEVPV